MFKYILKLIVFFLLSHAGLAQLRMPSIEKVGAPSLSNMPVIISINAVSLSKAGSVAEKTIVQTCGCQVGCSVLPVSLLSFKGKRINADRVMLFWKTTNEIQNKGFDVERSTSGANNFKKIAFVPALQNNNVIKNYELPDDNNFNGISYYRLKQLDIDDRFTYSEIITVKGLGNNPTLRLYPNPAAAQLSAEIFTLKKGKARLSLLTTTQHLVMTKEIEVIAGLNIIQLPVGFLASGLYFIKVISSEEDVLVEKFIKL